MTREIIKAYQFRLYPNAQAHRDLHRFCTAARYAYNWCLALYQQEYAAAVEAAGEGEKPETVASRLARKWSHYEKAPKGLSGLLYHEIKTHRKEDDPWQLRNVHSHCYSNGAKRVVDAYKRFFELQARLKKSGKARGNGKRPKGLPRFKRRGEHDSFTIQINRRCLDKGKIRVPMLGWIRVRRDPEALVEGEPISLTVTRRADYWECSVTARKIEIPELDASRRNLVVGIDLGVNAIATVASSDGTVLRVEPPRPLQRKLSHLAELQRRFALRTDTLRCDTCKAQVPLPVPYTRGRRSCESCGGHLRRWKSKRAMRLQRRIARLHYHVAQIRKEHLHQLSNRLLGVPGGMRTSASVWYPSVVVVEGYHVTDLVEHGVPRSLQDEPARGKRRRATRQKMLDLGWGELRRQLEYKSDWRGVSFVQMPRTFASDKTCHRCGHENEMPKYTSEYACSACGLETTRQENTAKLLVRYGSGNDFPGRPGRPGATRQQDQGSTPGSPKVRGSAKTDTSRRAARRGVRDGDPGVNICMDETYPGGLRAPGGTRNARKEGDLLPPKPRAKRAGANPPQKPLDGV